jgi:hypothetical protein
MKITLSPQRSDKLLAVSKQGDSLTINGVAIDLSVIPDGATLPDAEEATGCEFLTGDIERVDGDLQLTLILPHGADASEAARFPAPIVNPPNGLLDLPQ